jgi:hypothetical protein
MIICYFPEITEQNGGKIMTIRRGPYRCALVFSTFLSTLIYAYSPAPFGPKLSFDTDGNVVAIWSASSNGYSVIQQAQLPMGGSWTTPITLSSPTTNAFFPAIYLNESGTILSSWQINIGTNSTIAYTFNSLTGPTAPLTVSTPLFSLPGTPLSPYAILDPDDRASFVFQSVSNSCYIPVGGMCSLSDRRFAGLPLSLIGSTSISYPSVAFDPIRDSHVFVWQQTNKAGSIIYAYTINNSGTAWENVVLSSPNISAYSPHIASHPSTVPAVTWHESSRIAVRPLNGNSSSYLSLPGYTFSKPHLALNASSHMILSVEARQNSLSYIAAALYDPLTGWGPLAIISEVGDNQSTAPEGAITDAGDCIVIWQDKTTGLGKIKTSTYPVGTLWHSPVTISDDSLNNSIPSIYLHNTGYTVAIWSALDSSHQSSVYSTTCPSILGTWTSLPALSGP